MSPLHRLYLAFVLVALHLLLAACGDGTTSEPPPAQTAIATPDPLLATPHPMLAEEPLQGQIPEIPNIFIVPARQSKPALAAFLKTTPDQLDWVNPGLADSIDPGTLVVIPPIYRMAGETLSEVAQKTGLSEDLLRAANPKFIEGATPITGTVLAVPALYIVPADTLLSSTAATLATSSAALLSANPELANRDEILAGTVLVVPPESEDR